MIPLRLAKTQDAPQLAAILQSWLDETEWMPDLHSLDETEAFLAQVIDTQEVWVAGDCMGFLAWDGTHITQFYMDAPQRGGGVGSFMLAHMMLRQPKLRLWTFQANARARRFYVQRGFTEVARSDGDNAEGLPDVELEWKEAKR